MTVVPDQRSHRPITAARQTGVVIMLGSNIEPQRYLPAAVSELAALGDIIGVSNVWQTAPVGDTQQADFCNAAVLVDTTLEPARLLVELRDIENRLGRVRDARNKNAARTIDLDLAVIPGPPRMVAGKMFPDPDIGKRIFLALPLQELLPAFHLPSGRPIAEVVADLQDRDAERLRLKHRTDINLGH